MSDQFLGEIRLVGFNFPPYGWALCNGQLLPISQYSALFSLFGINYGGNGTSNFGLPNLQASTPLCFGDGPGLSQRDIGDVVGSSTVTLLTPEMPAHTHLASGSSASADNPSPAGNVWATLPGDRQGSPPAYAAALNFSPANLNPMSLLPAGSSLPHNNHSPYLVMNYVVALEGNFPVRG